MREPLGSVVQVKLRMLFPSGSEAVILNEQDLFSVQLTEVGPDKVGARFRLLTVMVTVRLLVAPRESRAAKVTV